MPDTLRGGLIGPALLLLLAGCAGQTVSIAPQQALASLKTGQAQLACRESCLAAWQAAQPRAAELAAGRRWGDLAALVLGIGYQDDLTLYYLGNAAEGIGSPGAAASYYRQSLRLSGTTASCLNLSRLCGGVVLPRAASVRLAAIERELRPRDGLTKRAPRQLPSAPGRAASPARDEGEPAESEAGAPSAAAVSTPGPEPSPGAARAPSPAPPRFPDYIEPPPAGR